MIIVTNIRQHIYIYIYTYICVCVCVCVRVSVCACARALNAAIEQTHAFLFLLCVLIFKEKK